MKRLVSILIILFAVLYIGSYYQWIKIPSPKETFQLPQEVKTLQVTSEESAVTTAVEMSLPSVVTISIKKTTQGQDTLRINPLNPLSPFERIPGAQREIEGDIGSGFVVKSDGLIVTNKHVVSDEEASYTVIASDDKEYPVTQISRDPLNDIAILKIDAKGLKALPFGDSAKLKLGQTVIAMGTPLGEFRNSVTKGIISGLGRGITAGSRFDQSAERLDDVIQTDAAINPGNSGGPLVNLAGEVVGVNVAVSQEGQSIGFAIPINVVRDLTANYTSSTGLIQRPFLGVRYQILDKQTAILHDVPEGAYVVSVEEDSGAEKAGIKPDDILTAFEGKPIKKDMKPTLQELIQAKKASDVIKITLWRDGKQLDLSVKLGLF